MRITDITSFSSRPDLVGASRDTRLGVRSDSLDVRGNFGDAVEVLPEFGVDLGELSLGIQGQVPDAAVQLLNRILLRPDGVLHLLRPSN